MSSGYLLIGVLLGGLLVAGGFVLAGGDSPTSVDGNAVCENRFGENWTNQNMTQNLENQTVGVSCTNGTATRNISVNVDVEGL